MGYAQQTSGELHEYVLQDGRWSAQPGPSGLVSKNAKIGAPVTAISYTLKGTLTVSSSISCVTVFSIH